MDILKKVIFTAYFGNMRAAGLILMRFYIGGLCSSTPSVFKQFTR
jgi:hypothetical protein